MSEIKVNKISPRTACGTTTLGDSGDTFTIPSGVSITNQGTASGFGSTGEVSWNTTVKTSTFTVTAGEGFFCNTTSGGFTANLPAGTAGSSFAVADYAGTFQTGNLTISPNGSQKIGGVNADVTLVTEGQAAYFVYIDDTQGWINVVDSTSNIRGSEFIAATGGTITTVGNCKVHTFTGPGTFTVSQVHPCAANNQVSYMVVAGGGAGGPNVGPVGSATGGGGGAGGFREDKSPVTPYTASPLEGAGPITVTATAFPITVGAGGAISGPHPTASPGNSGGVSTFSTITSAGGGGGGNDKVNGTTGGSGGGRGGESNPGPGAAGNTPPVSPPQGEPGGAGGYGGPAYGSGGGGGATGAGGNGSTGDSGDGGTGATSEINGSPVGYSGGGGGGGYGPGQAFGTQGGGNGTRNSAASCGAAIATAGADNTGGGGGGGGQNPATGGREGAAGGSGIVIIRYKFQ